MNQAPEAAAAPSKVRIIGVPMDLGAGRRGVDMGPSAIRIAQLHERINGLGILVEDGGNIRVPLAEEIQHGQKESMYLEEIGHVCRTLAGKVRQTLDEGRMPLILGGDHSLAVGSVSGVSAHYRERSERVGLIWIDAHTDMNLPETSPSGNVHGMPLACLLGMGPELLSGIEGFSPKVSPENVVVVGARSIDRDERENIRRAGIRVITMKELDMSGMTAAMGEALRRATRGTRGFHCSFDLDVVDPQTAPGVGTPVPGGITYRESHLAMEMIHDSGRCLSLEMVEVNPILDSENRTGQLAVDLCCSALGRKIL